MSSCVISCISVVPFVVDLASVLTPDVMAPILANPEVQQRLLPYLPSGESLPQSADEIQNTLTSPQFQQVRYTHVMLFNHCNPSEASLTCDVLFVCAGDEYVQQCTGFRSARSSHESVWAAL